MVFRRIVPFFSVFLIIIAVTVALAQQPARRVGPIVIEGLQRLSSDEVVATSGLKTGTVFSIEELDAAGQRLVDSGLFAKVAYRTATKGNLVTVVFQVEENKGGASPVAFDNFVWFTNDELFAAIRRKVPSFKGNASDTGTMTDTIRQALQDFLKEHQIAGTVEYAPSQSGEKVEHLYSVSGVPIPICKLHFPGAKNVSEEKLVKSSKELTDADYSRQSAIAFSDFVLKPIYRQVGQLHAKFAEPIPKFEGTTDCKGGVELSIPVAEGPIYLWAGAEWSGNQVLSPNELDAALGMKNGEVANGVKIDKGLMEVGRRYGLTGHLEARTSGEPEFDDAASRVSYKIVVKEGPQFKMGKLTIKGLSEADANSLEARWKLKNGEVFDTSYSDRFLQTDARDEISKIMSAWQTQHKSPPQIRVQIKPNQLNLNADVIIEFKSES